MAEKTSLIQESTSDYDMADKEHTSSKGEHKKSLQIGRPNSTIYIIGCLISLAGVFMNAFNFVTTQLLDDIAGAFQLNFGMNILIFCFALCSTFYTKEAPHLIRKANITYMLMFMLSNFLYGICAFLASVHIPVGTLNAVLVLSFVVTTLCFTILKTLCNRAEFQRTVIVLDVVTVVIVSVGVIFIVQPTELFYSIKYFDQSNPVYTSLCNSRRFTNFSITNDSVAKATKIYISQSWQGYIFAFLCGLINTLTVISIQKLLESENLLNLMFWMSLFASIASIAVAAPTTGFVFPQGVICFILLLLQALTGALYYWCFYVGLCYISSIDVAIITGFILPLLFAFQFTFLSTRSPTPTNAVAIVAAVVVLVTVVGKPILQGLLAHHGYIN